MESNFGGFDPTSGFILIYPGLLSVGRSENKKNLCARAPGLQIENYFVWYENCSVRGERNATLHQIKKKFTHEMDKLNAQNYMKYSKKVLKKCLKLCGKVIYLPPLNDGKVKN